MMRPCSKIFLKVSATPRPYSLFTRRIAAVRLHAHGGMGAVVCITRSASGTRLKMKGPIFGYVLRGGVHEDHAFLLRDGAQGQHRCSPPSPDNLVHADELVHRRREILGSFFPSRARCGSFALDPSALGSSSASWLPRMKNSPYCGWDRSRAHRPVLELLLGPRRASIPAEANAASPHRSQHPARPHPCFPLIICPPFSTRPVELPT
jgi:hypothetical protein